MTGVLMMMVSTCLISFLDFDQKRKRKQGNNVGREKGGQASRMGKKDQLDSPAANLFWGLDTDILPLPCAGQTPQTQVRSRWHGCPQLLLGEQRTWGSSTSLGRQVDFGAGRTG